MPLREAMLYGRLAFHGGKAGRWFTTWAKLAEEIGVRHRITVYRLLLRLRERRLVTWKRHDQYSNLYQVIYVSRRCIFCNVRGCKVMQRLRGCRNATQNRIYRCIRRRKEERPPYPNTPPSPKPDRKHSDDCASSIDARGVPTPISGNGVVSAATAAATGLFQEFLGVFLAAGKKLNKLDNERARKLLSLLRCALEHGRILEHLKRSVTDGTWSSDTLGIRRCQPTIWSRRHGTRIGPGRVLLLPPRL